MKGQLCFMLKHRRSSKEEWGIGRVSGVGSLCLGCPLLSSRDGEYSHIFFLRRAKRCNLDLMSCHERSERIGRYVAEAESSLLLSCPSQQVSQA